VNLPIQLDAAMTVSAAANSVVVFYNTIDTTTTGYNLTVDTQGEVYLLGGIGGSGGLVLNGFFILGGSNTYSGKTLVAAGTVHADSTTAFGAATGAGTELESGVVLQVDASLAEPLTLDAGSTVYMLDSSLVLSG